MKRKLLLALATTALAASVMATSAFAMGTDLSTVNADCYMRTAPGTSYEVLQDIPSGAEVFIDTADNGSGWAYVSYNDMEGWIPTRFLTNYAQAATSTTGPASGWTNYTVNANYHLRSGPGTNYGSILTIPAGSVVTVDSISNGWAHTYYNGYTGYLYTSAFGAAPASTASTTSSSTTGGTWYNGYNYANVYNYSDYRAYNPDLVQHFGNNAAAYLDHFVNYGMSEGRRASQSFEVNAYRAAHPDLNARFGDDLRSYYLYACGII